MVFWEQVLATFFGATFGFLFSLVLFYVREWRKNKAIKNSVLEAFRRETQYNRKLFERWEKALQRVQAKVAADDRTIVEYIGYTEFLRSFLDAAFREGILFERVDNDFLQDISQMLTLVSLIQEQLINQKIIQWNLQQVTKKDITDTVNMHLKTIETDMRVLGRLASALKS